LLFREVSSAPIKARKTEQQQKLKAQEAILNTGRHISTLKASQTITAYFSKRKRTKLQKKPKFKSLYLQLPRFKHH